MTEQLTLRVDGRIYGGWESVEITRRLEAVAGGFRIQATDRWPGQNAPWPIHPGDACQVEVAGTTVLDGYVDRVEPSLSGSERGLSVAGRDKSADLVDCAAVHAPGEWSGIGLLRLARALAQPFGVKVTAQAPLGEPFLRFALQPGETAWEALERACRLRGVLATGDGAGGVLITRASRERASEALVQGRNILAARGTLDLAGRFSSYTVRGQSFGTDTAWGEAVAAPQAEARDRGVARHRPQLILAEGLTDAAGAAQRAQWEAAVRAARAARASITVQGWTQRDGSLWRPNQVVEVDCPWLRLAGELLVEGVALTKDNNGGTLSVLELVRPGAMEPQPEVEPAPTDAWGWG